MVATPVIADSHSEELPLVTIGMPIRNGDPYFELALESVLAQDYPNLEIVVSDNGSTDGTSGILARVAALDPRIRLPSVQDSQRFKNFEWVLRQARGRYFMWVADDDLARKLCRPPVGCKLTRKLCLLSVTCGIAGFWRVISIRCSIETQGWGVFQGCVRRLSFSAITFTVCGGMTRLLVSLSSSIPGGLTSP